MHKIKHLALFLALVLVLSACGKSASDFKADHKYDVESFKFTNQNGEKVSLDDLKGDVWLATFVFTNCTTVCPPMMFNMAELQDKLVEEGVEDYKIVAFSVDPEVDTPEKLTEYLEMFNVADASKWELLTGYTQEEIAKIAVKSFKTPVIDDPNSNQVTHGTAFYLVDQNAKVVKSYSGASEVPFEQIVTDMKILIESGPVE